MGSQTWPINFEKRFHAIELEKKKTSPPKEFVHYFYHILDRKFFVSELDGTENR